MRVDGGLGGYYTAGVGLAVWFGAWCKCIERVGRVVGKIALRLYLWNHYCPVISRIITIGYETEYFGFAT
jgi:hypothetical protein